MKNWFEPKSVRNIQVFLGFANFYQQFIQGFSMIARPLTLMPKTLGFIGLSTILQSIDPADKDEVGNSESSGNEMNLSNPSVSEKSIKAGYLTFISAKKGNGHTKKAVKAVTSSN